MAARILHFGADEYNRLLVLQNAGYSVEVCPSLPNLNSALQSPEEPAIVLISDTEKRLRHEVVTLVHTQSTASVILFQHTDYTPDESEFDLVIPNLTPAKEWLAKVAETIERSRTLNVTSQLIRQRSAALIEESGATRQESAQERRRSARIRSKSKDILDCTPDIHSSRSKAS